MRYGTAGGSTTRLRVAQPGSNNVAFSVQVALSRGQLRYGTAGGSTTSPQGFGERPVSTFLDHCVQSGNFNDLARAEIVSAAHRGIVSNCFGNRGGRL